MREYATPGGISLEPTDHLVQPLIAHAEQRPDRPLMAYREGDAFVEVTAQQVWDRVLELARGLIGLGVQPDDRVALMSASRVEWILLDYAILAAGAVTVPIYETSSAEQVEWILSDSGTVVALFETDDLKKESFDEAADRLPACRHALVLDSGGLDQIREAGADVDTDQVRERLAGRTTASLATLIYTSGTTGRPKGCELTHENLRWDAVNSLKAIGDLMLPESRHLMFLPMAHSFAKILAMVTVERGALLGFVSSLDNLTEEMPLFKPTIIAAVPRIFERVYNGAQQKAHADGKGAIFDKAAEVAERYARESAAGTPGLLTRILHAVFDRLVYSRLREVFGGDLREAVSGGGPLGERLNYFFNGVGVTIYEGYGLTETSPVLTVNHPGSVKVGTVGRPLPGTTIRIADDGEILAKGPQIFRGYHDNEEATREAIDDDGWFHTGDIGELDDGFLRITGRKKELIVTAAGKNVAPAVLEDRIKRHPLISQAMVVGDNRKFISALVTIDEDNFPQWAKRNDKGDKAVADLTDDPELRGEVQGAIDEANKAVSRAESVREFRILPHDFTVQGGELTPTLKVKRRVVEDSYGSEIESIYRG